MSQRPGRARLLAIVRQCLGQMRGSIVTDSSHIARVSLGSIPCPSCS